MVTDEAIPTVRRKYQTLSRIMDERMRRRWAASEAIALGWGGITAVAEATGLSQTTIRAGIADCRAPEAAPVHPGHESHVRSPGGGRERFPPEDRTLIKGQQAPLTPPTQ